MYQFREDGTRARNGGEKGFFHLFMQNLKCFHGRFAHLASRVSKKGSTNVKLQEMVRSISKIAAQTRTLFFERVNILCKYVYITLYIYIYMPCCLFGPTQYLLCPMAYRSKMTAGGECEGEEGGGEGEAQGGDGGEGEGDCEGEGRGEADIEVINTTCNKQDYLLYIVIPCCLPVDCP